MESLQGYTGKFRLSKAINTRESLEPKISKRQRDTHVCAQCRIRKLRCDRGHPCSTCAKRGDREACSYAKVAPESRTGTSRFLRAEDRLAHLEQMLKVVIQSQTSSSTEPLARSAPQPLRSDVISSNNPVVAETTEDDPIGHGGYTGSTHWSSILEDIQEIKSTLNFYSTLNHDGENGTADDSLSEVNEDILFGSPGNLTLKQVLLQALPPREKVEHLISIYFSARSFIAPVVHMVQFRRQCESFWADPLGTSPLWISILFSVCYMAEFIDAQMFDRECSKHDDSVITSLFRASAHCLVLGSYHQPKPLTVEALALHIQCSCVTDRGTSRHVGVIIGALARLAYMMGYHRDPDNFKHLSPFEGEMRRRTWAVCQQYDLVMSFQMGLPSSISPGSSDTKSPRHLLDSDFDEDTKILPDARPDTEYTPLLYFIVKDAAMACFCRVCYFSVSLTDKSDTQLLELDAEIRGIYSKMPEVMRARYVYQSVGDDPSLVFRRLYIEFLYQKCLCVLYREYMTRGHEFGTKACIDAAMTIVKYYIEAYTELLPGGRLYDSRWLSNSIMLNDFLLSVMILCLGLHLRQKKGFHFISHETALEIHGLLETSHSICLTKSTTSKESGRAAKIVKIILEQIKRSDLSAGNGQAEGLPILPQGLSNSRVIPPAIDLSNLSIGQPSDMSNGDYIDFTADSLNFCLDSSISMDVIDSIDRALLEEYISIPDQ